MILEIMTVREIAKLAGVSIGTVDRVIHSRGRVSPETAKKIGAIIDKHQFTPNPIARRLKRNRAYRFCALVPQRDQDSGYWGQIIQGIQGVAHEMEALGVETEIIEFDHYDSFVFEKATKEILRNNPDGVIFAPIHREISEPFAENLDKKQIPYVFFDSRIPDANPICSIGQDSFRGGYLAGKLLQLFIGSSVSSVAVLYAKGSFHIEQRRDGFLHYTAEQGIKAEVKNCYRKAELAFPKKEIANFFMKRQGLQGVFVSYSEVQQIAEIAEDRRKNGDFFIVGYDLVPVNHKLLKEGRIDAIISQRPQEQSRQALLSLYHCIVLGYNVEANIEMPLDIYVKENVPEIDGAKVEKWH